MPDTTLPHQISRPGEAVTMWVIYDHPDWFPDGFVLRAQFSTREGINDSDYGTVTERLVGKRVTSVIILSHYAWTGDSADEVRALLPAHCIRIGPEPGDHASICEVWMDPT